MVVYIIPSHQHWSGELMTAGSPGDPSGPLVEASGAAADRGHGLPPEDLLLRRKCLGHTGRWLALSLVALCGLAVAAAVVSYSAQYRMVFAAKRSTAAAALEAGIPDVAALVFAALGIALALHGRRALRPRVLNVCAVATSVAMNVLAAGHGWRGLAIWAMPPVAYALASDTAIGVVRAWTIGPAACAERGAGRRRDDAARDRRRLSPVDLKAGACASLDAGRFPALGDRGVPGGAGSACVRHVSRDAGTDEHQSSCHSRQPTCPVNIGCEESAVGRGVEDAALPGSGS
jgi:Protein of unknown function (DUF2637)